MKTNYCFIHFQFFLNNTQIKIFMEAYTQGENKIQSYLSKRFFIASHFYSNLLFLHGTTISEYLFVDKLFSLIPTIKWNESGNNRFFPLKLTRESNQIVIISFKIRYETWFLILLLAVLAYGNNCRIRLIIHRWRNSQLLCFSLFAWSHGIYIYAVYNFERESDQLILIWKRVLDYILSDAFEWGCLICWNRVPFPIIPYCLQFNILIII